MIRDYPSRKAGGCPTSKCQHDFSIYFRFAHGISKRMSEGVEAGSVSGGVAGFQEPGEPSRKSAGVESEGIHPEFREQPDIPCPSAIFDTFEETLVHKRRVDRHNALTRRGFQALFFPLTGDDETPYAIELAHIRRVYLRQKGSADSWWILAAETLERFPEDGNSVRMAGDALVDEALAGDIVERLRPVPEERRDKLREGAALLQRHWDEVRHYEQAAEPNWSMVGYNLVTAYRALGDLDQAKRVAQDCLRRHH